MSIRGSLRLLTLVIASACLMSWPQLAAAQTSGRGAASAPSSGSIAGTVVMADAPETRVRRATITLEPDDGGEGRTLLGADDGRFVFTGLAPGRYTLAVQKAGYLRSHFGATRPGRPGTAIVVAQSRVTVVVPLTRGAVITGTVRDPFDDPVSGALVEILRVRGAGQARRAGHETTVTTDDRGVYRAFDLPPGDYVVAAQPRHRYDDDARMVQVTADDVAWAERTMAGGRPGTRREAPQVAFALVYHPGSTDAATAQVVPLAAGAERTGIDITLRLQPTTRVHGTVTNPDGSPAEDVPVYLVPDDQSLRLGHGGFLESSGPEFSFGNVAPGRYMLMAKTAGQSDFGHALGMVAVVSPDAAAPAPAEALWAAAPVTVSAGPMPPIALTLEPGFAFDGRVAWADSGDTPRALPPMSVILTPMEGDQRLAFYSTAAVDADGRFRFSGVLPGRYTITAIPAKTADFWSVQSVAANDRDVTDLPLEIGPAGAPSSVVVALTREPTDLEGRLTAADGRAAPDYHVVAFPVDRRYWMPNSRRIRAVRPSTDGRFAFEALPPADYYLAALTDVEPREWFDAAFLDQLIALAIRVRVAEGTTTVQDLKIAR